MYNMSNLPIDMVEEILSRIPLTSLRAVRSTCKKWNSLFKDKCFTKKHLLAQEAASRERGEFMAIGLINFDLFLMSFDLRGIYNNDSNNDISPFVNRKAKLISLDDAYKVDILEVCYCDGLLLCITRDNRKLIVWNPYTGQTRWISVEPISMKYQRESYYLGYDKNKSRRAHKILRLVTDPRYVEEPVHEIFDLNSNSWRVLDVIPDCWMSLSKPHALSLKGKTYWYGELLQEASTPNNDLLVCFDFTTELFGPHLPLPFKNDYYWQDVSLSSLREEKIVVLHQHHSNDDGYKMEIWVSTNIEQVAVSWSKFFAIDMKPLTGFAFHKYGSFIIDEERRAVIVYNTYPVIPNMAYIIGENNYFKEMNLEKFSWESHDECLPLLCSYVSSSVQMNQPA